MVDAITSPAETAQGDVFREDKKAKLSHFLSRFLAWSTAISNPSTPIDCISTRADVVSPKYKLAGEPYDIHSMSS